MLTIKGKALGQRRPLFADFSIPLPDDLLDGGRMTLRDLVECVVSHEVHAFSERQQDRSLVRVLTAQQIEDGADRGKVDAGGSNGDTQAVDGEQAVASALQAFVDGMFLVVLDEVDCRDLDAEVFVRSNSKLTFVRLTLLAGG